MTDDQEKDFAAQSEGQDGLSSLPDDGASPDSSDASGVGVAVSAAGDAFKVVNENDVPEDDAEAAMLQMLEGLPQEDSRPGADEINFSSTSASKAEFQQLQQPVTGSGTRNIELLMDVDLPISIELGRTKMSISDILSLGPGSVVELNKLAGEPVDLLVNQKVVARGEVVVVDENFGLRITQLMTPEERLRALAEE
jgi:flagellar motor switch protein FliN/FliY